MQLAILSMKLPVILGINAAVKIFCPVDNNHVKIRSVPPPVIPPYTNTDIGVPTSGAITDKTSPVNIATFRLNSNFLAMYPTITPIIIFTMANGISLGLVITPCIILVNPPVNAPAKGPNITATKIVPIVSKNNNGICRVCIIVPKTMLITIPNEAIIMALVD